MESFQVVSEGAEFVTLDEAKRHLIVDHSDDDLLILSLISAARKYCEKRTNRFFTPTNVELSRNGFCERMPLKHKPVQEIVLIQYDDQTTDNTLGTEFYDLDPYNNCVIQAYEQDFPSTRYHWNSVRITYRVGYYSGSPETVSVPEDAKRASLLILADLYEHRERQQDMQLYTNKTADMLLYQFRVYE